MSDYDPHNGLPQSPFNALPAVVVGLALLIGAIEIMFQIGSYGVIGGVDAVGWRISAIERFGFFDVVFESMRRHNDWPLEHVMRFFTYGFVHSGMTHAAMGVVFVLALGKKLTEIYGAGRFLAIFCVSLVMGSLCYGLFVNSPVQLNGVMPGAYGLIGAYGVMLWLGLGVTSDRARAIALVSIIFAIQPLFLFLFGGEKRLLVAMFAGAFAGIAMAFVLIPGMPGRILGALRKR